jgi:hypothetical protein
VLFLGCEPKTVFGDPTRQETTPDGLGKYVAQCAVAFRVFNREERELINVGVAGETDPCAGISLGAPVELVDFEIGLMEKKNDNGDVVGVQVWYRAKAIRPTSATSPRPRSGSEQTQAG